MKRVIHAFLLAFVYLTFAQMVSAQTPKSCWPQFHKDAAKSGTGDFGGTGSDLSWSYQAGGAIKSAPIVGADGTVYFTCDDGNVYGVIGDAATQTIASVWISACNCSGSGSPAIASDGTLYVPSQNNVLYVYKPDRTRTPKSLSSRITTSITIGTNGVVYFGTNDGLLYARNADGSPKWTYTTNTSKPINSTPALDSSGNVYFGGSDGLYSVTSAGAPRWKYADSTTTLVNASPLVVSDTVYFGSTNGYFYAVATSTGTRRWRANTSGEVLSSAAAGPTGSAVVYFGSNGNKLNGLNTSNGLPASANLPFAPITSVGNVYSSPAVGKDGGVYFGSIDGKVYSLNADGSLRWQYDTGYAIYSSPAIGPAGALIVGNNSGMLYCFAADKTRPNAPVVTDDGQFTATTASIRASWLAVDPESGISSYDYCVGTAPGLSDIVGWTSAGSAKSVTRTGLSLVDKKTYYITVRAYNGAGVVGDSASSDGITIDATPPTVPTVTDTGLFTSSTNTLSASWSATDPESGVTGYEYSIGTSAGGTNTLTWTSAGSGTSITKSGLSLLTGVKYYINVRAINACGTKSDVGTSDGITADSTPPAAPIVTDKGQYFSDPTSIYASWSCADSESAITKCEYSIGTTPGGTQVLSWTDNGGNFLATIIGLSLTNGSNYYVNVRATNGAGLVSVVGSSDGIVLDITPPVAPVVTDDGAYTSVTTELHATWTASDTESGIKSYKYAVGTTSGGTDVVNWADNGTSTTVTVKNLSLVDKKTYYISVKATNNALAESSAGVSNGITVDITPPNKPVVTDDGAFTADNTLLNASWTSADAESGLVRYEYSIGTSAGATDVLTWTNVDLAASVSKTGLSLQNGKTYYVNVRAYNSVGLVSQIGSSDGIFVDSQMPPAPTVTDDGVYTASGNKLHATWTSVTCPSGIASYEYSIGTSAGAINTKGWTSVGKVNEITATGLSLGHGTTYYINVRARNTLGKAGDVGSSDGIFVDVTAPPAPAVTDAGAFTGSPSELIASWTCSDPESGIAQYEYAIGNTPQGTSLRGWTSIGTNISATIGSLLLADGATYYISVKATNNAGSVGAIGCSDGIKVDLTPPSKPTVTDSGEFTTDSSKLHALWSSTDAQSGIARYEYSIGLSAGAADILDWTSAGNVTDYTITGLSLASGSKYFINVRAVNQAGLKSDVGSSDGIFVDSTPPNVPQVTDEGDYTSSTTTLSASWTSEDLETGIDHYEYSIGTASGLDDVVSWINTGQDTSVKREDLSLNGGTTYYFNVRATNKLGLTSDYGSSDGITVDTTAPSAPTVTDDGTYTFSLSELHVTAQSDDVESGIASYDYAVGTAPDKMDVVGWTAGGPGPDLQITGLSLNNGQTYYIHIRAINGAGIVGDPAVSDGIKIDSTPPMNVSVIDDGDYTSFNTTLHGKWSAVDPESGIAKYEYCIGTVPGQADVADWFDVGSATEHTRENLSLVSGQLYYITVRATNGAGAVSNPVSSNGIKLDLTPPNRPIVTDTGTYWGYKSNISANWSSSDPESGVAEYQVSVGTSPGSTDIANWLSVGSKTTYLVTGLKLTDGVTYYINVKARNGGGMWSEIGSSDGVLIDSTPPTTPKIIDDGDLTSILDRLHATWHSEDPESGIAEYVYCIGTSPGATDVVTWTSTGLTENVTVTNLKLDPVLRYYFSVKARSNSGAWSAVSASDGIGYSCGSAIWSKFRGSVANIGQGLFNGTTVAERAWTISTQGAVESSAAIAADGTAYIGSGDGKLYAVTQNGVMLWVFNAGGVVDSSPAIASDGKIVFGCGNGKVYCLSAAGETVWEYQTGNAIRCSPLVDNDRVYIGSYDSNFYALSMENGAKIWSVKTGGEVWSSPAIDMNGVVYFGGGDGYVYAINRNGSIKWKRQTGSSADSSPAVGSDGTVYIGSGDSNLYALNPDGTVKWKYFAVMLVDSSPAIGPDGTIYVGAGYDGGAGKLLAINPNNTKKWQVDLPNGGVVSSPAVDPSGMIYVGSSDGNMYAFRSDGTKCWSFKTGSTVMSSPALGADSSVVFGSYDGNIYCLRDVTSKDLTPPTIPVVTVPLNVVPLGSPVKASWSASDPDSMVAEYTYAIGSAPGLADITGWTSAGIETSISRDDIALIMGQTYYVSVKARNPSQRWSDIGVSSAVNVTGGMAVGSVTDIGSIESGVTASLVEKVVTGAFDDCFFVAESDRSAGLRCVEPRTTLKVGDMVDIQGTVAVQNGEKVLATAIHSFISSGTPLRPFGIAGKISSNALPVPYGLSVRLWGKVAAIGDGFFILDNGSGMWSPRGIIGIEVRCSDCSVTEGELVSVSGVLCHETVNGEIVPVLRVVPSSGVVKLD